jgi:hypothetical protein
LLDDRREQASHLRNEGLLARIFEADLALIALEQVVRLYGSDEELSTKLPWLDWPTSAPRTMRPNTPGWRASTICYCPPASLRAATFG